MPSLTRNDSTGDQTDPPTLLAILIGARRAGDRTLEAVVRRQLENEHRIKVCSSRGSRKAGGVAAGNYPHPDSAASGRRRRLAMPGVIPKATKRPDGVGIDTATWGVLGRAC